MSDKEWWWIDCPKCGGKDTVECFEQDGAELRVDSCSACDYYQNYNYIVKGGYIHIEPSSPEDLKKGIHE